MKNASETERIALKQILKLKKDGGSREDALALAKLSAGHPVTIPKGDQGEGERANGEAGRPAAPFLAALPQKDQFIALATLLSTTDTLLPTVRMAMMAATEISEAISTYSMAVAPSSFFINLRKMDSINVSWHVIRVHGIDRANPSDRHGLSCKICTAL